MYQNLVHHGQQDLYINAIQQQFQLVTIQDRQQIQIYQYWLKIILELHQT